MSTSVQATEDGWRELINGERQNPGLCYVTLAQFDNEYEVVYPPTVINAVPKFGLVPRGSTALLDATGRFITEVGEQLSALPEHKRPGQGMEAKYAMTYDKRSWAGTGAAFASTSDIISAKRMRATNSDDGFSEGDRRRAMGQ
jgi:hypothetical protein